MASFQRNTQYLIKRYFQIPNPYIYIYIMQYLIQSTFIYKNTQNQYHRHQYQTTYHHPIVMSIYYQIDKPDQQTIIEDFDRLKEQISIENLTNVNNLQSLTNNCDFLFNYLKQSLNACFIYGERQKSINKKLISILQMHGHENLIEQSMRVSEEISQLDAINEKLRQAIKQKHEMTLSNNPTPNEKAKKSTKMMSQTDMQSQMGGYPNEFKKQEKMKNRAQYHRAVDFVKNYLIQKMQYDHQKLLQLPKNSILNLYLKYAQQNGNKVPFSYLSSIQMALTNQLKRHFHKISHNQKSFKGIKFKEQFKDLMKTDVKLRRDMASDCVNQQSQDDDYSPPLPDFDEEINPSYKV